MIRVISDHWSWSGYPKGTHPQKSPDCCPLEWNSSWVKLSSTRFSIFQRNMRFILNLKLQKVSWLCPFVSAEGGKVNDNAFTEVCSHYLLFLFFSIFNFKLINLAEPVGPWKLTFALGLTFLHQTHMHIAGHVCWAPWISRI